jgi:NAD(P)H-flavin reductase/ferredoxin
MTDAIQIQASDLSFPAQTDLSIVDAALRAGIELPYSCRKGVCGSCAGRVVLGATQALGVLPLRNEECGPDQVLLCQCRALPGMTIAPIRARRIDAFAPRRLLTKVYRNTLAAPDVSVLELRLPAGQRLKFRAGQYVHVHLGDGSTRSFSMANPPQRNDSLTLHVRHVPGGRFSSSVAGMARGDALEIEGPFGSFSLDEEGPRQIVMIAGGTGFAPIHSLLEDIARRKLELQATLIWGGRVSSDLYAPEALTRWRKMLPHLSVVRALEDPGEDDDAIEGRVDDALRRLPHRLEAYAVYACGSPAMVEAVRALCTRELGLLPAHFHCDAFVQGPAV